ncbi:MAG: helix-turn-helix domain-containing protein [Actinomycetota bacterium]
MAAQRTETGIGRALRRARLQQGKSLEDASRDTRVRTDYLDALEREDWGALAGDVYVRGFLRSYARYLGLSPDKVISVYERANRRSAPPPAPVERSPGVAPSEVVVLTGGYRRPSWLLAAAAAAIALAAAAGIGLFNRSASVPETAGVSVPPSPVANRPVTVDLVAIGPVNVEVIPDDDPAIVAHFKRGESQSFQADEQIVLHLSRGGQVEVRVNGVDQGTPGVRGRPFQETYEPTDFRGYPSPSPPASP